MTITETMGLALNHILKELGISQKELSARTGITQANISKIASGKADASLSSLEKIANALEINIADLFGNQDDSIIRCPYCGGKIHIVKNK